MTSEPEVNPHQPTLIGLFLKITLWTFFFLFIFFVLTFIGVGLYAWRKAEVFASNAQLPLHQIIDTAKIGWNTTPHQTDHRVNFLVLGSDSLSNRGHATELTDTMLLVSVNLQNGSISLFSIPRDLWIDDYKTKINALYQYGKDRYPSDPQRFPREVLENQLGLKIHHTVLIDLSTLANLIDEVGGVDVNVKEGFVDPMFPREDVDVTKEKDPKKLYETVEFKTGVEHMSGKRVLEYVRSRHSASDQGNDVARGQRQQEVIFALLNQIKQPAFFKDVARDGKLYHFYEQNFGQYLPVTEAIGMAKQLYPHVSALHFVTGSPSIFPDDPKGNIWHPPLSKNNQNQWIYQIKDVNGVKLELRSKLNLNDN